MQPQSLQYGFCATNFRWFQTVPPELRKENTPVRSAQFAVNQCFQPQSWTRTARSERESSRIAFLFDQVYRIPHWLKSQGLLGGCKAQPWQALTSSETLTPTEQQHWNNAVLQRGSHRPTSYRWLHWSLNSSSRLIM